MKVSVVICTYNRGELLEGSVRSLDNQEGIKKDEYEIIIVDDGSTDDTADRMKKIRTGVSLSYFHKDWGGRSEARNLGINKAKGEVVLFVDDDVIAPPWFITNHLRHYEENPGKKIIVRGPIINIDKYEIPEGFKAKTSDYSGATFCTCNASTLKKALIDTGGFDESFKEYGFEDNEMGWRLLEYGCKVEFDFSAHIFHYKPIEWKEKGNDLEIMKRRAQELGRSGAVYLKKHPHWKVAMAVGVHPLTYYPSLLLDNPLLCQIGEELISKGRLKESGGILTFFTKRIFRHTYLKTLLSALKQER